MTNSNEKPEWETDMEDFIDNMTEEEWEQFKIDTGFDFYNQPCFDFPILDYNEWASKQKEMKKAGLEKEWNKKMEEYNELFKIVQARPCIPDKKDR